MLKRRIVLPPEHLYPPEDWRIVETRYTPEYFWRAETIFALSNGYVGVRGTFDEGRPAHSAGTFVNGFYESWPIRHPEEAHGLATAGQTMVMVPDATVLQLYVDDEPFFLPVANCRRYRRVLDMRCGILSRDLIWSTPAGKHVGIRSSRLVSLDQRHVIAISYEVVLLDHPAPVVIRSAVVNTQDGHLDAPERVAVPTDPRVGRAFEHRVLHEQVRQQHDRRLLFGYETANSHMTLGVGVEHLLETGCDCETTIESEDGGGAVVVTAEARPGEPIMVTKLVTYHSSRSAPVNEVVDRARRTLDRAARQGFGALVEAQRQHLDRVWDRTDVEVAAGSPYRRRLQQAVRWNLFQLLQASWHAEGSGIPARGLTSQVYEGHYFWDTEMYMLPFLTFTQPRLARNLLRFRHSMIDTARARAAILGQKGALFPWRTINGEEASANFQTGTAQYHIDADIAYAVQQYVDVRGDVGFLSKVGAEILVETARLWASLGFYDEDGEFHIHGVTGPDEYTTVVNDNTYTNLMARFNLNQAVAAVHRLQIEDPDGYTALYHTCRLRPEEVGDWERAASAMHVPYSLAKGVHPQDAAFLDRELWDLPATPAEMFPLLLHYHPLVIYRHQVLKQADIVLAMFLLGHEFSVEQKRRNFDYYDPLTTGDSSLSAGIESIIAAEVGHEGRSLEYFTYALLIDLADTSEGSLDGFHLASAGSTWMALVFGFGGMRAFDGHLSFDPHLPAQWESLTFPLRFRDRQLRISLTHSEERYVLEEGDPLEVTIRGERAVLARDTPIVISADASRPQPVR